MNLNSINTYAENMTLGDYALVSFLFVVFCVWCICGITKL